MDPTEVGHPITGTLAVEDCCAHYLWDQPCPVGCDYYPSGVGRYVTQIPAISVHHVLATIYTRVCSYSQDAQSERLALMQLADHIQGLFIQGSGDATQD